MHQTTAVVVVAVLVPRVVVAVVAILVVPFHAWSTTLSATVSSNLAIVLTSQPSIATLAVPALVIGTVNAIGAFVQTVTPKHLTSLAVVIDKLPARIARQGLI
jgi:hypothetical protein